MTKPEQNISEQDLIAKIRNSDEKAFKILYRQYSSMLYAFLWRKTGNSDTAEDLIQELFIKVWNNRKTLDADRNIKAYLYRSANNLAIDHLRSKKNLVVSFEDNQYNNPVYNIDENFDLEEKIKKAVKQLPAQQQNVFWLSRFEGLKYGEIAEMLNIAPKTVENHIAKALVALREKLKYLFVLLFFMFYLLTGYSQ